MTFTRRIQSSPTLLSSAKADKADPEAHMDSDAETEKDFEFTTGISTLHHMVEEQSSDSGEPEKEPSQALRPWTSVHSTRAARDAALFWSSMYSPPAPLLRPARVLCVARRYERKSKFVDFVGEYHLDLIQEFGGAPIMVPRTVGTLASLLEYLPMDGLLVVEGNDISDDVLRKYKCSIPSRLEGEAAAQFASDTEFDISKDELECALMRYALLSGCPILGLCRGSQMLNVLRGGTLYGDLAAETGTTIQHLQPNGPTYDSFRHPIDVHAKTPLAHWFHDSLDAETGGQLMVNSYHHQGSKELGSGLLEMACAPDGVTEAFYDEKYDPETGHYVVGLQFHPERMLGEYPGCKRVYENFLRACCSFRQRADLPQ
mmetsp:Transcript_71109/g.169740  ORF Transcript_71109/g.169740 Transcript_71109/m.169740 type:complete len:373 (-) Transcript_71109:299-1417(-)|eukprot:CAMPEP_0181427288 /NCGR_PEP_ID=MMETSP1110-20121109/16094_1 /TAXON_ID=174948 /ORGANISM="Symbiodinium sp., Strain CCMP421" /LENGTH=372 /DNA_ID=CAMNT_0023550495 /DNA_START=79 /DNA_END=1197 /DNA_ORIENTATION=-